MADLFFEIVADDGGEVAEREGFEDFEAFGLALSGFGQEGAVYLFGHGIAPGSM